MVQLPQDESHLVETELDSTPIYEGRVVNLHLQTVKLPNGEQSKREIIKHSGAAAVVPLLPDGQVILIRQFRKPFDKVIWEIPAGTLEKDEDPQNAAHRELQEEIGYAPEDLIKLGGISVAPGYTSEFIHIYLADKIRKSELEGDVDEFIDMYTMPLSKALEMVYNGEITDAKTVTGLLLAQHHLNA